MKIDRSRVIVGFRRNICDLDILGNFASSEAKAWHYLTLPGYPTLPGLVRVARRLKYLNTAIVEIKENDFDDFRDGTRSYDPIEYCDLNYYLKMADLTDLLSEDYKVGIASGRIIRKHHISGISGDLSYGVGARIAMLDSGIAPHPFLPSLSSSELRQKKSTMHISIPASERDSLCNSVALAERNAQNSVIGSINKNIVTHANGKIPYVPSEHPHIYSSAVRAINRFDENRWTRWEQEVTAWVSRKRSDTRPPIPCFRSTFGPMRMISPFSKSFVEEELASGILDVVGHGTAMAGIISGLNPQLNCTDPDNLPDIRSDNAGPLELDIVGVSPYAELIVLKCCHEIDQSDQFSVHGCMITILDAITYLIENKCADVAYIGFSFFDCDPNSVNAANGLLANLKDAGCIAVAPAGNDPSYSSLGFPASSSHVRAIAALVDDENMTNGLIKAEYSAVGNRRFRQKVAFSAYGGDKKNSVITTSKDAGYSSIYGSSVSAAIAAGIYAVEIAEDYVQNFTSEYKTRLGLTGPIQVSQARISLSSWNPASPLPILNQIDTTLKSRCGTCAELSDPDADMLVGAGVLRI